MNLEDAKRVREVALLALLFLGVFVILGIGSYKETGGLSYFWNLVAGIIPYFGLVIVVISTASILQKYVLKQFDKTLLSFADSTHMQFIPIKYSLLNNPGEGSIVRGQYRGLNLFLRGFFHGYQLGRKSFIVEVDGVSPPSKLLFSNNRHKFPNLDFWDYKRIPSFSSFLCEHGPLVRLKNAHVLELPLNVSKTHYLVSEKKEYGSELLSKKAFDGLSGLDGAIYLDGKNLYYGQKNLPRTSEELGKIVDSLVNFTSTIKSLQTN
jgi:hypothetical protein